MLRIKYNKVENSSNINGEFYDAKKKVLYLRYLRDNSEYKYEDVSKEEYAEFAEAKSKGRHVALLTRSKKFTKI